MKKLFALLLALSVLCGLTPALAEDTGIKIINGPEAAAETVNLDDWKVGQTVDIPGFGTISLNSAEFVNFINYSTYYGFDSGSEADYLKLVIEILNTQTVETDFYKLIDSGICTYDEIYQFGTWKRQYRSLNDSNVYEGKDDSYAVGPMYRGKYIVVVTLPNDVVSSKKPLSITFKIGDNECTYHHRK